MNTDIAQRLQSALEYHQAGKWQEASDLYQAIIDEHPGAADAWHLLGLLSHQLGKHERAVELITKAIDISPQTADFYCNLAEAKLGLGIVDEAIEIYEKAIELNPQHAGAHNNLGNIHRQLGKMDAATDCYSKAISIQADFFIAHNNLGLCARAAGNPEQAIRHYQKAIHIMPNYAEAHNNLGNAYLDLKKSARALEHYEQATRIAANYAEAYSNMGNAQRNLGKLTQALQSYDKALSIQPDFAMAHYNRGVALDELRRPEEAIEAYENAIRLDPAYADAHNNLGFSLQELGRAEEAIAAYRKTLELKPDYAAAHLHLSMIVPEENSIGVIHRLLKRDSNTAIDISLYHFALGNIYNSLAQYDSAFAHYQLGNQAKRNTFSYESSDYSSYVDALIENFDEPFFNRIPKSTIDTELPVFIIGLPRSGSTLVEQVLSSHSLVYGAGELTTMGRLERSLAAELEPGSDYPANIHTINIELINKYAQLYLDELTGIPANILRVSDKDPGNFHRIGLIKTLFPDARIIHCERNPVATCLSIYFNYFSEGNEYSFDLNELRQYYRDYHRLMQHWSTLFDADILQVSYEELVSEQESVTRKMLQHIGLEWEPACLDFHLNRRAVRTASSVQVRQPLYQSSLERWKHYQDHLGPLLEIVEQ